MDDALLLLTGVMVWMIVVTIRMRYPATVSMPSSLECPTYGLESAPATMPLGTLFYHGLHRIMSIIFNIDALFLCLLEHIIRVVL